MSAKIKTLVVEDEPLAREGLLNYLQEIDFAEVVGVCENALQANEHLASGSVDLMLLDIQMPKVTGIEFIKSLKHPPLVIFTTAYPNFALQGYELDILDYLVKPFPLERLLKAMNKAREFFLLKNKGVQPSAERFFFVKCDQRYEKIIFDEVLFVEGMENYVVIHTLAKKFITLMRMKDLEEKLPANEFIRVHKSYIVAVKAITSIDGNDLIIAGKNIPMSREKKSEILEVLLRNKAN
jgi:DNA-binding LytR/AlgR family response regulator